MDQVQELSDALPMPKLPSFHVEINQCGYRYVIYLYVQTHTAEYGSHVLIWKLTDSQGPILADTCILF